MSNEELKQKLFNIEIELDKLNGDYGTKEAYCIYCKSNKYNSTEGIIHRDYCIIKQLRNMIKFKLK